MSVVRITLFGKFQAEHDGRKLEGLEARKVQELLCYLLLYRDRPHPRETLASLLWGDTSTVRSKKYLRQTLWQLQAAFEAHVEDNPAPPLLLDVEWVQLNPDADLWLDVAEFEQAFASVQGIPGQALDRQKAQALRNAVQLYRSDLLGGWYQDWFLCERERLQNLYLTMLDKLMSYCQAHHQYEAGLAYGMRILSFDRARERTHRRLMRLHYLAGNRTAALRQYESCVAALDEELKVTPARSTVALYRQIRDDRLESSVQPAMPGVASEEATTTLPQVLDRLKQFQALLADMQLQLQQEIRDVEMTLKAQR